MTQSRPAAVAGSFYPDMADELARTVANFLGMQPPVEDAAAPKVLLVPHAGYVYSGAVAARAYAHLRPIADRIRRVVLLGPAHRVPVRGLALPGVDCFETPLGRVDIDPAGARLLAMLPQVETSEIAHAREHSLEVQLPFLQILLKEFALLPLVVGDASSGEVAEVLELVWGGPETLILISSDLSHYHRYPDARRIDARTIGAILAMEEAPLDHDQACGATPINGLLAMARRRGLRPRLLELCNSGDTAGPRDQVVGYAAVAFYEKDDVREH